MLCSALDDIVTRPGGKRGEDEDLEWGGTILKTKRALIILAISIETRGKVGMAWVRKSHLNYRGQTDPG